MAKILDGHALGALISKKVSTEIETLKSAGVDVGLGILQVADEASSGKYSQATLRACKRQGIKTFEFNLPEGASVGEILNIIHSVNADERINGLLVLFPLPRGINPRRIVNEISPEKDVDGLGYLSIGRLAADETTFQLFETSLPCPEVAPGVTGFLPCTPFGVIRLLKHYKIPIKGANAVVIGKSLAVGKPLSQMLLALEATVTICHKETRDMASIVRRADIICSATGVRGLVKAGMVKKDAIVVDIGINVLPDGKIVGDVDYKAVSKKASYITPVPGGVGPVTIAMLLENTVRSAMNREYRKSPLLMV